MPFSAYVPDAAGTAAAADRVDEDCVCRVDGTTAVHLTCFSGLLSTSGSGTTLVAELHDDRDGDAVPHLKHGIRGLSLPDRNHSEELIFHSKHNTQQKLHAI